MIVDVVTYPHCIHPSFFLPTTAAITKPSKPSLFQPNPNPGSTSDSGDVLRNSRLDWAETVCLVLTWVQSTSGTALFD